MKNLFTIRVIACAFVFTIFSIIGLVPHVSAGGADVFRSRTISDVDQTFFNVCTGEDVRVVGQVRHRTHLVDDADGGFHMNTKLNWTDVNAVGLQSDEVYEADHVDKFNLSIPGGVDVVYPVIFTQKTTTTFEPAGDGDNLVMKVTSHLTVNANGDVTASFSDFTLECVPQTI